MTFADPLTWGDGLAGLESDTVVRTSSADFDGLLSQLGLGGASAGGFSAVGSASLLIASSRAVRAKPQSPGSHGLQ